MTVSRADTSGNAVPAWSRFLLDEEEASQMCGVSRPTWRRWVREGLVSPVALPHGMRRKLYRRADVERFVLDLASDTAAGS